MRPLRALRPKGIAYGHRATWVAGTPRVLGETPEPPALGKERARRWLEVAPGMAPVKTRGLFAGCVIEQVAARRVTGGSGRAGEVEHDLSARQLQ